MTDLTEAWVNKAEADLATAEREFKVREQINCDAICFHAQQCVMKYLQARLQMAEIPFPHTQHLVVLLELCQEVEPQWEMFRDLLRILSRVVSPIEEPDICSDFPTARLSVEFARVFRAQARKSLGLD